MNITIPSIITWPPITNWRTSSVGAIMIIAGLMSLMHVQIQGVAVTTDPWTLISGGFGLILAKDGVVHSTIAQVEQSTVKANEKSVAESVAQSSTNDPT
ncbi:MAG: hypothetical protein ABSD31_20370 [Candidatus Binataceae bacterium]|jgi:hypothetical protein